MSTPIRNDKKKNRRSRKKRRTEDFSSDSSDSSDSESSSHTQEENIEEVIEEKASIPKQAIRSHASLNLDDIDVLSDDDESNTSSTLQAISDDTHKKLRQVNLTTTMLSNTTGLGGSQMKNIDTNQVKETISKDKTQLNNEYLMLMASTYGNDLDELRKKPDFTQKSLVILAKALQSGANMFDEDTLNAILSK
ncbi:ribosome assembly protein 3 [[Candida] railenensis]|uniref:Ribosome assembly protein 3 n=1 Tax=[Candida] railenensis TaxID=45579 RepID=A0A9P0VXX1_9ASCO|nr:ribosome assembly protein 3 [[Candida] railenensis]